MCSLLTSNIVLKIILDALFEFKSKNKYERKMLNRLKRNCKRKIYINSFCLMSQVRIRQYFCQGDYYKNTVCLGKTLGNCQLPRWISRPAYTFCAFFSIRPFKNLKTSSAFSLLYLGTLSILRQGLWSCCSNSSERCRVSVFCCAIAVICYWRSFLSDSNAFILLSILGSNFFKSNLISIFNSQFLCVLLLSTNRFFKFIKSLVKILLQLFCIKTTFYFWFCVNIDRYILLCNI